MSQQRLPCPAGVDDSFGPWAGEDCRGGFDFTLLFEETILTIPLLCLFLAILPVRILRLATEKRKVVPSILGTLKIVTATCLIAFSITQLALWARSSATVKTRATIPAAILTVCASIGVVFLTWLEHERNIKPSFILFTYFFLSTLLDLARLRTLLLLGLPTSIPATFIFSFALRLVMLVLESTEKRRILIPGYKGVAKEETSSTLSRSVFLWLAPLFLKGYKKILGLEDLDLLNTKLRSEPLYQRLQEAWQEASNKTNPGVLYYTWLGTFLGPVMAASIPKLFEIGFTYSQPFLVNAAIKLASQPQMQPYDNTGYGLIGAYAIVYTGIAISTGQHEWRAYRAATIMRGSVIGLVYQKSLRLDLTSPEVSPEGALTLVTTDVETISQGVVYLHEIWGALLEIAIGIYLLYRELGAACAMPVALVFAVLVMTGFLAVPIGNAQAAWIQASQDRVTTTSKVLGSIKSIKVSGLTDVIFSAIRTLRSKELEVSTRYRKLLGVSMVLLISVPIWSPILTFAVFAGLAARGSTTLTISKAFTAFALFVLVNKPLTVILIAVPLVTSSATSFQRIQDYLNGKERRDMRLTPGKSPSGQPPATSETGGATGAPSTPSKGEKMGLEEAERVGGTTTPSIGKNIIASIDGKFSWADAAEPVIDIRGLEIPSHTFTLLLGTVGCGKSTLVKALLGEISSFQGTIYANYSNVAYCSQSPWISNETVQKTIVGAADFNESWYEEVIRACALEKDVQDWLEGDQTIAGTMGISLSGGQRQRLSIARALYSGAEFLILDDPFCSLDSATEDFVFNSLLGPEGMLRRRKATVLMTSSDFRRVPFADQIIFLDVKGRISRVGTPKDFETEMTTAASAANTKSDPSVLTPELGTDAIAHLPQDEKTVQRGAGVVANLEFQANAARRLGDSNLYGFYAGAVGRAPLAAFLLSMIIFAFCSSFPSIWLKWWAEDNLANPNRDLGKWIGVYVALGVGSAVAILFCAWKVFITIINNSGVYFHELLVETTSKATMSFHAEIDSGVTVNRFSQDLQLIDMELPGTAFGVAAGIAIGIADFIVIAISSKYLAAILPFILLSVYLVGHFYLRTSRQLRLLDIEHKAPLYSQLITTLSGLSTIRAFNWQSPFEQQNLKLLDESQRPSYLLYCIQRWLNFVVDMMIAFIALVLIIVITTLRERIGPGYTGVALSNILGFSGTVKAVVTSWVLLEIALGAVMRVRDFERETKREESPEEKSVEPNDWPSLGAIEFSGVTASYRSFGRVLHDITFSVQPGEKVTICGRTGSGKSSLVHCLLRLLDLDSGSIAIDGVDLSNLPPEFIRARISAVPQDPYLFDEATIRYNLDPTHHVSDEEIVQALEKVRLWDKIQERGGLDAVVKDEDFFSKGEKQLLAFARGILRKSKILILDEFDGSLDEESSSVVYDVLRSEWLRGCTVFAITHRLEGVVGLFDKVVVLDSGRVVEFDEPGRLVEREGSAFASLFEASARGR